MKLKINKALKNLDHIDYRSLIPLQGELKELSKDSKQKAVNSLNKKGFFVPFFVWEKEIGQYYILDGHQRQRVLIEEQATPYELPCIVIDAENEKDAKEKLLLISSQYGQVTKEGFDEFSFDIDVEFIEEFTTFDNWLDIEAETLEAQEDDYQAPEEIQVDVVKGDIIEFICKDKRVHRLMCGDSTSSDEVGKLMENKKADIVFTDPPYRMSFQGQRLSHTTVNGVAVHNHKAANTKHEEIKNDNLSQEEFLEFISDVLSNIILFNNGAWYICFSAGELHLLLNSLVEKEMKWKSLIIWMKNQATLSNMDYKSRYEVIVYGQPGGKFYGERFKQEDIWQFQKTLKNDLHPTMKPIPLIENAINNSSEHNSIVLDLFLGSGSTMVAAHQLKRVCYGMELDEKYCQVIIDRMRKLDETIKVKINGLDYEG